MKNNNINLLFFKKKKSNFPFSKQIHEQKIFVNFTNSRYSYENNFANRIKALS